MSESKKRNIEPQDKIQFRIRDDLEPHVLNEISIMSQKLGKRFPQAVADMFYEQVEIQRLERKQRRVTVQLPADTTAEERRILRKSEELQKIIGKFAIDLLRNPSLMYGKQEQSSQTSEKPVKNTYQENERINNYASNVLDLDDD